MGNQTGKPAEAAEESGTSAGPSQAPQVCSAALFVLHSAEGQALVAGDGQGHLVLAKLHKASLHRFLEPHSCTRTIRLPLATLPPLGTGSCPPLM